MLDWDGAPLTRKWKMLLFLLRNDEEIILAFNHTAGGPFTSFLSFLRTIPWVCQSLFLTLPCLEVNCRILGENQPMRAAAPPS